MDLFKQVNKEFIKKVSSLQYVMIASFSLYTSAVLISLVFENINPSNPLAVLIWFVLFSYSFTFTDVYNQRRTKKKEDELAEIIENPSGMTWTIYTSEGATIGEIKEADYFRAKHEADLSMLVPFMQVLNFIWVAWRLFVQILSLTPVLLVVTLFIMYQTSPEEEIMSLTIGQIMASGTIHSIFTLLLVVGITLPIVYIAIGRPMPGYKNFRGMRLQRILSRYVPNIANANGFSVQGCKDGVTDTALKTE